MVLSIVKATLGTYAVLAVIVFLGMNNGPQIIAPEVAFIPLVILWYFWWAVPLIVVPICLSIDWFRLKRETPASR